MTGLVGRHYRRQSIKGMPVKRIIGLRKATWSGATTVDVEDDEFKELAIANALQSRAVMRMFPCKMPSFRLWRSRVKMLCHEDLRHS